MTDIWLILWIVSGTPDVHEWNGWAVWLAISVVADFLGGLIPEE